MSTNKMKYILGGTAMVAGAAVACAMGVEAKSGDVPLYNSERTENNQQAVLTDDTISKQDIVDKLSNGVNLEAKDIDKDETVYVFADASGKKEKVLVNEVLKNKDGSDTLTDKTDLKDIVNVKGDESFSIDGDTITWQANGNDITYQGTSDKELPVELSVSYMLDGKEVSPESLAGASGRVTIRFDYKNNAGVVKNINGRDEDINVPFIAITGCILGDNFSNIEVTNGKLMSEGASNIVVGYAMPGLLESIKSTGEDFKEKLAVPEYVEINADVVDFSLDMTATIVVDGSAMNIGGQIDLSAIDDVVDSLSDATTQLVDGSSQLSDGAATYFEKMGEFDTGVNTLKTGIDTLSGSSTALVNGIYTIDASATAINNGIIALDTGLNTPMTDEEKMAMYTQAELEAQTAVANQMVPGNPVYDGIAQTATEQFKQGVANEQNKQAVATALDENLKANAELYGVIYTGVYELAVRNTAASYGMSEGDFINFLATDAGAAVKVGLEQYAASTTNETITSLSTGISSTVLDQVADSGAQAMGYGVAEACKQAAVTAAGQSAGQAVLTAIESTKQTIAAQIEAVQANGYSLVTGAQALADGTTAMSSQTPLLVDGITQLTNGAKTLKDGSALLVSGAENLNDGAATLKDGLSQYNTEAISVLVNSYNGDIKALVERLSAVAEASTEYDTYTMLLDGANGATKFIIKTAGIN